MTHNKLLQEFRAYHKTTAEDVTDRVKMDAFGDFHLDGKPIDRELYFVEWRDTGLIKGDGAFGTFRQVYKTDNQTIK